MAIRDQMNEWPVAVCCRVLNVARSGYYAWLASSQGPGSLRKQENMALSERIEQLHDQSMQILGSRKIHHQLTQEGVKVGRNRVHRLMRKMDRRACYVPRKRRYARVLDPARPNLLERQFDNPPAKQTWVSDITQLRLENGCWFYLATVLSLPNRRLIGHSMSLQPREELVIKALEMARRAEGLTHQGLFHSDQGVQYRGERVRRWLLQHGFAQSMSRKGNCWDNACAESWFSLLKREWLKRWGAQPHARTKRLIQEYIEYYNFERPHGSLGYKTPYETVLPLKSGVQ
ncbi:IS3 family transposase [Pseudomonas sp. KNUC1026]|uniref:IS3 family transposase n=1 Tax=Pseudomonas sp. KNUC1026 TaxID=2893890 RepID=UPI001F212D2E|nr:IS3 family transposase [Pseudomonas sp. KNUC1026]UFH49415.1 IS3 family transposase [Pseudomonas sp. KNUC1026]